MIKLGRISYVNMAPVFYRVDAEVEEIQGVPTELNRMLIDGELDTAPISSIEYARNADKLRLLPRLCVASEGAVDSIQLVSRKPLEQVRVVAVTPESATSVALTKVLLPEAGAGAARRVRDGRRRREAPDRRRRAEVGVRGSDAALRPRPPLARADRACRWSSRCGRARSRSPTGSPSSRTRSSRRCGMARAEPEQLALRGRRSATAIPPASSRATSRSCATASARASAPASTRSSSSRATPGCSRRCPSCASCIDDRSGGRMSVVAESRTVDRGPREGARRRAHHRRGRGRAAALARPRRGRPRRRTRSATGCTTRTASRSSSTATSTTRTSASPTATSARSTARPGDTREGYLLPKPVIFKKIEETLAIGGTGPADAGRPSSRSRHRLLRGSVPLDQGEVHDPSARAVAAGDPAHLAPLEADDPGDADAAARRRPRLDPGRRRRDPRRPRARHHRAEEDEDRPSG